MTLLLFMLILLAATYWAAIADPRHQRSHSIAFMSLLLLIGAERYRAETETQGPMETTAGIQSTLAADLNNAYEKGKQSWYAKQNSKLATTPSPLSQQQPKHLALLQQR